MDQEIFNELHAVAQLAKNNTTNNEAAASIVMAYATIRAAKIRAEANNQDTDADT